MNCILVNDSSTVSILPIKNLKKLGIPMYELFPIHLKALIKEAKHHEKDKTWKI